MRDVIGRMRWGMMGCGMRDVIGRMICGMMGGGYAGGGYAGCYWKDDMRDEPPPRNHPGRAAVFGTAPPNPRRAVNENGKRPASRKKNAYFSFKLLIINYINQYFNIHLHLISFIIYNR